MANFILYTQLEKFSVKVEHNVAKFWRYKFNSFASSSTSIGDVLIRIKVGVIASMTWKLYEIRYNLTISLIFLFRHAEFLLESLRWVECRY